MYKIQHNPFMKKTDIWKNGRLTTNEEFSKLKGERFQNIVDEIPNTFADDSNEKTVTLYFVGRTYEYIDLKNACENYEKKEGISFDIEFESRYDHIDVDKIKKLAETMKRSPIEAIRDPKSIDSFLAKLESKEFDIAVVATVSSGKSTLINAMIGASILPSGNEATTAKIFRIKDIDGEDVFKAKVKTQSGEVIKEYTELKEGDLKDYNDNKSVFQVDIEGDFKGISSEVMNLVLIDTPGTNNSQNSEHKKTTFELIKDDNNNPIVLFVLDATKPKVDDESTLLTAISEEIRRKNSQLSKDRFIFVLNKADAIKKDEWETKIEGVKSYLANDFKIKDAKIYPISSEAALVVRKLQNNIELDEEEELKLPQLKIAATSQKYAYKHFEKYAPLSNYNKEKIAKKIEESKKKGDWKEQAIHHSGITSLEMVIDEYVNKYAIPLKINEIFEKIDKIISVEELEAELINSMKRNKTELADYEKKLKSIREQISKEYIITNFKKKVQELKIDEDPIKEDRKEINRIFTELFKEKLFTMDLDISEAKKQIEKSLIRVENLQINIQTSLEQQLRHSLRDKANKIIGEFRGEIGGLFDDQTLNELQIQDKKAVMASLPTSNVLLEKAEEPRDEYIPTGKTRKETRIRKRKKDFLDSWWMLKIGELRGDYEKYTKEVPETRRTSKQVSNHHKIKKSFMEINQELLNNLDEFELNAKDDLNELKQEAIKIAENFIYILKKRMDKQQKLARDKKELQKQVEKYQSQRIWLEDFRGKRDEIYRNFKE